VGVAANGVSGKIELTFSSAIALRVKAASGMHLDIQPGIACVDVCGYFLWYTVTGGSVNGNTITITFNDGTNDYTATGTLTGGRMTGTFTGGGTTGNFTAYAAQSQTDVVTYCGGWQSQTSADEGSWLLLKADNEVTGWADVDGTVVKLTGSAGSGSVSLSSSPAGVAATGQIPGTGSYDISGTFTAGPDHGIWSGYDCDSF
jgi:hypothetical protein